MTKLADIHPDFRQWLESVGKANGKGPMQVYELWRKYARDCQAYDQSPVKFEFLQWNELKDPAEVEA